MIDSHLHGWGPKLAACYFNININNAYKVFCYLYKKYHPANVVMELKNRLHNLTHSLLQRGENMRKRKSPPPPSASKDITTSSSTEGRKVRTNSLIQPFESLAGAVHAALPQPIDLTSSRGRHHQQCAFSRRRLQPPWRVHQSVPMLVGGLDNKGSGPRCSYKKCLGYKQDAVRSVAFNRIQVMAVILRPLFGVLFYGGISP
jgi:hypothetical protein